ncbi:MAG: TlpA family protein disulfide reductase [Helicobacteraceae bacterium]|jgi:thiol-disulfide isomerase/thioredoxin|nr:TlpA family protein disulfide reductase [Helicobacteraceae bacterium]
MLTRFSFAVIATFAIFFMGCEEKKVAIAADTGFELRLLGGDVLKARVDPSEGRYNNLVLNAGEKPALYVFFTTVCPECAKEIPHIIDMKNHYKDSVNIVGVLVENKNAKEVADFVEKNGINYPVAIGAGAFRLADAVGGVRLIPAIHIYDGKGKYVSHFVGPAPQEMLETRLNPLLGIANTASTVRAKTE